MKKGEKRVNHGSVESRMILFFNLRLLSFLTSSGPPRLVKESFGPRKENSLRGPLLNHLTSRKQNITLVTSWCSRPVASIWDLSPPVGKPTTPSTRPEDLSPPDQLQVSSQQKNTQNIPPDWRFPYRFHKPPYKFEASLIPLDAQPGR